jgi:hypothetical protein
MHIYKINYFSMSLSLKLLSFPNKDIINAGSMECETELTQIYHSESLPIFNNNNNHHLHWLRIGSAILEGFFLFNIIANTTNESDAVEAVRNIKSYATGEGNEVEIASTTEDS